MRQAIDIFKISRVEKLKEHPNYLDRLFTNREKAYLLRKNLSNESIAGIISAKESFFKSLGIGISGPKSLRRIEILHKEKGKPYLNTNYPAMKKLILEYGIESLDISISHDGEYVVSSCLIRQGKYPSFHLSKEERELSSKLARIDRQAHKYEMGSILIVGGSPGMTGAPLMASQAAMRAGAGIVYLLVEDSIFDIVQIKAREEIVLSRDKADISSFLKKINTIIIGPGLEDSKENHKLIKEIVEEFSGPIVIDAGGINIVSKDLSLIKGRKNLYLTPHLMEFSRLSQKELIDIKKEEEALNFVKKHQVNLLLKGSTTLVLSANSSKKEDIYKNKRANPGMASAGSGDVLSGIIAAILAKEANFNSFKLSVLIHSLTGEISRKDKGEYGMIASDLIENIPYAIKGLRRYDEFYK